MAPNGCYLLTSLDRNTSTTIYIYKLIPVSTKRDNPYTNVPTSSMTSVLSVLSDTESTIWPDKHTDTPQCVIPRRESFTTTVQSLHTFTKVYRKHVLHACSRNTHTHTSRGIVLHLIYLLTLVCNMQTTNSYEYALCVVFVVSAITFSPDCDDDVWRRRPHARFTCVRLRTLMDHVLR